MRTEAERLEAERLALPAKVWDIDAIKTANRVRGLHFFDPDTLRFFKSRIGDKVYQGPGGVYFVTSERRDSFSRAYTVREFNPETAGVRTAGSFAQLSKAAAHRWALDLSKGDAS